MTALAGVEKRRIYRAPRDLVWAVVADTNRWDRAAGLAPARYSWKREGQKLLRAASAPELMFTMEWIEPPYGWVEGHFVEGERRFTKGPVSIGGFRVQLADAEGGTEAIAFAYVHASWAIGVIQKVRFGTALTRYLDSIGRVIEETQAALEREARDDEPAVVRARRILARGYDDVASGPRTPADEVQLGFRAERLRHAQLEPAAVDRLVAHLRDRPDEEVAQMRPFELAKIWELDRREVLRTFLHGTQAGLVELSWQINCPICRVGARIADGLAAIDGKSHCGACEIDYEVDFARHVEAVFGPDKGVRQVETALYCASSPAFLPHVFAQLRVASGGARTERVLLPPGPLHVRTLWIRRTADIESMTPPPALLRVKVLADTIEVTHEGQSADGKTELAITNASDDEAAVLFERGAWEADVVLGTTIASMSEFATLFATEAPAAGVELKVGHVALLFSDLTGSTALYERVGDARAFAIVEDHFRIVEGAIAEHGGAIVKTMGDAVMASFVRADQAVEAGLAMVARHDAKYGKTGLGVKIGVHAGPCLAVRANDRLDYFGTTVNVAARLQAQAAASEVVITAEAAREPSVAKAIGELPVRPFDAKLKGIADEQKLVGIDAASLALAVLRSGETSLSGETDAQSAS